MRTLFLALALALALAVAPATGRSGLQAGHQLTRTANGPLTLIAWQETDQTLDNSIVTVAPNGQLTFLLRPKACCELQSVDWAPDGQRLAFTLGCVGCGPNARPGVYVAVPANGSQRRIQAGFASDPAWSPHGSRLAYVSLGPSSNSQGLIYVVNANGSSPRLISTGTGGMDSSPSWSPAGTRLAFAARQGGRSDVFVIRLDGTHRLMIAKNASAPVWSPNGKRIAVSACGGIKLITPSGKDVTPLNGHPKCPSIGVAGKPIWSPDGRQIAIKKAKDGIYTMDVNGTHLTKVTSDTGGGLFGTGKPTWQPIH